ncbi:TPA: restriction endonuclease [Escherichia coli]|nr:restriction endonuclease [Escherichia coli]
MSAGKLPEGWVDTQLGNVVDYGKTSKKVLSEVNDDTWILELEDIEKDSSKLLNKVTASERPFKSTKNSFRKGDILYGKLRPYLNKIIIANDDGVCTTEIIPINAEPICFNKYLFYWLKSSTFLSYVNDVSYGVNMPRLGTTDGLKAPLRLAPLAEQKIIAEKLDTLLAQVDSTKARLEQIPQILKRFRQAVLASALRGKLTNSWRINNKNSQDISSFKASVKRYRFETWVKEQEEKYKNKGKMPKNDKWKEKYREAITNQEISNKNIPDGWLLEPLDGLVYISARIGWKGLKASEYTAKGPLFLSVHALNYGKEVNLSQAYHISEHRYNESPEIKLRNDDILLCKDGAGIGKLAIVKNLSEPATINSSLLLIRAGEFFVPEYLFYFLSGPEMQNLVKERMTGSAVPHLFQRDVKEFVLEVPPLEEQHEIVRRVEQLFAYADTIEKQVNNALARVNNLTQSILAKAFRGELTAQWRAENPDLISGENSAAALLEKIKAERAASGGKKASRKKS